MGFFFYLVNIPKKLRKLYSTVAGWSVLYVN